MIFTVQSALILTEADNLFVSPSHAPTTGAHLYWDGTGLMADNRIYIILFIRSRAEENVKNEPLLIPRRSLHSTSVETGRTTHIGDYKCIETLHYYLRAAASTSVKPELPSISVQTLSTYVRVTDDADFCVFTGH